MNITFYSIFTITQLNIFVNIDHKHHILSNHKHLFAFLAYLKLCVSRAGRRNLFYRRIRKNQVPRRVSARRHIFRRATSYYICIFCRPRAIFHSTDSRLQRCSASPGNILGNSGRTTDSTYYGRHRKYLSPPI